MGVRLRRGGCKVLGRLSSDEVAEASQKPRPVGDLDTDIAVTARTWSASCSSCCIVSDTSSLGSSSFSRVAELLDSTKGDSDDVLEATLTGVEDTCVPI